MEKKKPTRVWQSRRQAVGFFFSRGIYFYFPRHANFHNILKRVKGAVDFQSLFLFLIFSRRRRRRKKNEPTDFDFETSVQVVLVPRENVYAKGGGRDFHFRQSFLFYFFLSLSPMNIDRESCFYLFLEHSSIQHDETFSFFIIYNELQTQDTRLSFFFFHDVSRTCSLFKNSHSRKKNK